MSDTNKPVIEVPRHDVILPTGTGKYGKKSPNAGKEFPCPRFSVEGVTLANGNVVSFADQLKWFGDEDLVCIMNDFGRSLGAEVYAENIDEQTGLLDLEAFIEDISQFTAKRVTLSAINEEIEQLGEQQQALMEEPAIKNMNAGDEVTEEVAALLSKIKAIGAQIRPLKVNKADIEAKYAEAAAKRKAQKEAKKNAPKPPVNVEAAQQAVEQLQEALHA